MLLQQSAALRNFDKNASPAGLFWRYGRARIQYFWQRLVALLFAGIVTGYLVSPIAGLFFFSLCAFAVTIDVMVLRHILAQRFKIQKFLSLRRIANLTAGFQALTVAMLVVVIWSVSGPPAHFFALVLVISAAIDAGMSVYYAPKISHIKQGMFAGSMVTMFAIDYALGLTPAAILFIDFCAACVLMWVVSVLLRFLYKYQVSNRRNTRKILEAENAAHVTNAALNVQREEAQKLALVAENVNDAIIISAPDASITWVNAKFTELFGFSASEAIGRQAGDILNGPWTAQSAIDKIIKVSKELHHTRVEIENITKSGQRIWVESSITPVFDKAGVHIMSIGVERDISVAKKNALALAEAKLEAENALRVKTEFLATMSHEIRTPMNGIIGMADLMMNSGLTADQKVYVKTITESGSELLSIIDNILTLSRHEAGKTVLDEVAFSPNDLVTSIHNLLIPVAHQGGLKLHLVTPKDPMPVLKGDKGQIRQILVNLVGNAVKFTESGSVTIDIKCQKSVKGHHLVCAVKDTGIGIAEDQLDYIFGAFSQVDGKSTRKVNGTGLGLSISKILAQKMGGDITVQSQNEGGSTFTFDVDLAEALQKEIGESAPQKSETTTQIPTGLKILVAEDNITNQFILSKMLEPYDFELRFADNGAKVFDMFSSGTADLILMDISMPVMNGLEATQKIRAYEVANQRQKVPIVALTANAFDSDRENCMSSGMDGFLTKPIIQQNLVAEIQHHIHQKAS